MAIRVDDDPSKVARDGALYAGIGGAGFVAGAIGKQENEAVQNRIDQLHYDTEMEIRAQTGKDLPDLNTRVMIDARITLADYAEQIGTLYPCSEQQANAHEQRLVEACQILAGPQEVVRLYNAGLATRGVPQLEHSLRYQLLDEVAYYGGGAMTLVCASIAAGAFATAMGRKFSRWFNEYSPITFVS